MKNKRYTVEVCRASGDELGKSVVGREKVGKVGSATAREDRSRQNRKPAMNTSVAVVKVRPIAERLRRLPPAVS